MACARIVLSLWESWIYDSRACPSFYWGLFFYHELDSLFQSHKGTYPSHCSAKSPASSKAISSHLYGSTAVQETHFLKRIRCYLRKVYYLPALHVYYSCLDIFKRHQSLSNKAIGCPHFRRHCCQTTDFPILGQDAGSQDHEATSNDR